MSGAGAVSTLNGTLISRGAAWQDRASLAPLGTQYLLVWQEQRDGTGFDIYGARLATDGTLVDPNGFLISAAAGDQTAPRVASDGTQWLVAWEDSRTGGGNVDVYGARVSSAGTVLDAMGIAISAAPTVDENFPAVAASGGAFLVAYQSDVSVHATRVSGSGQVLDPAGLVILSNSSGAPGRTLSGLVLEPGGAPSPYASVQVQGAGQTRPSMWLSTNDEGAFQFTPSPTLEGKDPVLRARNRGRTSELVAMGAGSTSVTIQLRPGAALSGRVVPSGGGAAVSGFTLVTSSTDLPGFGPETLELTGDRFVLPDVPAATLSVSVKTRDGRSGSAQATVAPGGRAEVTVEVRAAATVSGRVLDAVTRAPLPEVAVSLDNERLSDDDQRLDAEGRFQFRYVLPGAHTVRASAPDRNTVSRPVTAVAGQPLDVGDLLLEVRKAPPGTIGASFVGREGVVSFSGVTPQGPADRAGLRNGDQLVSVDGVAVKSVSDALRLTKGAPGSSTTLSFRRGGVSQAVVVVRAS